MTLKPRVSFKYEFKAKSPDFGVKPGAGPRHAAVGSEYGVDPWTLRESDPPARVLSASLPGVREAPQSAPVRGGRAARTQDSDPGAARLRQDREPPG